MTAAEWNVVRSLGACVDLKLRVTFTGTHLCIFIPISQRSRKDMTSGPSGSLGFRESPAPDDSELP